MPYAILCVDDQEHGLLVRKAYLERLGYEVLTATTSLQALKVIRQNRVDAVVLDYRMEGLDGEAVASILKRKRPELPIVLLTSYTSGLPQRARSLVDVVVAKGQPPQRLGAAIEKVLAPASIRWNRAEKAG